MPTANHLTIKARREKGEEASSQESPACNATKVDSHAGGGYGQPPYDQGEERKGGRRRERVERRA
jgi:hypothetical protein